MSKLRTTALALLLGALLLFGCSGAPASPPEGEPDPWIARTAIYEVFVRDFSAEGNFRGVLEGLDRIEGVGAEVVWLMPIHPIGETERKGPLGSPYSVTNYRSLNPEFGDEEDFRALIAAVHDRGMRLIMDWVPNHTSWDHAWTRDHPEWYVRDEEGRIVHPPDTDWTDVAQLDYGHPGMRGKMIAEMRYWIEEFGVDGYRVDVAGMVPGDFWEEAIRELRTAGAELLLAEWGDPKMHRLGFDLSYPWESYHALKEVWEGRSARDFVEAEVEDLRSLPGDGLRMRFTTNHDETAWDAPPVELFGGAEGARAAFVAMALLPGPPLIYNGQEVESPQRLGLFTRDPVEWDRPGAEDARAFYRTVIDLARTHPDLYGRSLEVAATDADDDVIAYRRGRVLVLVNTRPRPIEVRPINIDLNGARDLLSPGSEVRSAVRLPAYGAAVLDPVAVPAEGIPR